MLGQENNTFIFGPNGLIFHSNTQNILGNHKKKFGPPLRKLPNDRIFDQSQLGLYTLGSGRDRKRCWATKIAPSILDQMGSSFAEIPKIWWRIRKKSFGPLRESCQMTGFAVKVRRSNQGKPSERGEADTQTRVFKVTLVTQSG